MQLSMNVGSADRVVRIVAGVAMLSAVFLVEGPQRWFGLVGIVPLVTAIARFCPLYTVLGIRTCPAPKPAP